MVPKLIVANPLIRTNRYQPQTHLVPVSQSLTLTHAPRNMDGCHVVDGTSVAVAGRMDEEEEGTWKRAKSAWPSFELCSLWHRRERRMRMLAAKGVSLRH